MNAANLASIAIMKNQKNSEYSSIKDFPVVIYQYPANTFLLNSSLHSKNRSVTVYYAKCLNVRFFLGPNV